MTYANKTLLNNYLRKAQDIGGGAINLVNEFFSDYGIADKLNGDYFQWTLTDLDRALDEMGKVK